MNEKQKCENCINNDLCAEFISNGLFANSRIETSEPIHKRIAKCDCDCKYFKAASDETKEKHGTGTIRPVYPHETPPIMKPSLRIFYSMLQTADWFESDFPEWWANNCLDMCAILESHDEDDAWMERKWDALEEVISLIAEALTEDSKDDMSTIEDEPCKEQGNDA